jgi:hypothetical protein
MIRWFTPLLALALSAPAGAQQWQVARDQFAFAGRQLTVHVDVETEGTLRIIRGSPGSVRVSGRSDTGLTAAGLTADEHLTLTAAGNGLVEYVVSVPERVWVNVRLPDRAGQETIGGHTRNGTFQWAATMQEREDPLPTWLPQPEASLGGAGSYTILTDARPPHRIAVPDLGNIRSLTVRVEGPSFRVTASRPLALVPGDPRQLEIRPGGERLEIAIVVPANARDFTLTAAGQQALVIDGAGITVLCAPSTRQWLSGDRGWVTFTPVRGALECTRQPVGQTPGRDQAL